MSKEMTVIVLGVWVMLVPYLGVPGSWRTAILVISGLTLVLVGFFLRTEALSRGGRRSSQTFVENIAPHMMDSLSPHHDRKERINSLN